MVHAVKAVAQELEFEQDHVVIHMVVVCIVPVQVQNNFTVVPTGAQVVHIFHYN